MTVVMKGLQRAASSAVITGGEAKMVAVTTAPCEQAHTSMNHVTSHAFYVIFDTFNSTCFGCPSLSLWKMRAEIPISEVSDDAIWQQVMKV